MHLQPNYKLSTLYVFRKLLLTVIEVLPKEKRAREEKTSPIGQALMDLRPLLMGESSFSRTLLIQAGTTAENVAVNTGQNLPQVSINYLNELKY